MKIPPVYTAYCFGILVAFMAATYQGYAVSSIFSNQQKADKTVNHYHK